MPPRQRQDDTATQPAEERPTALDERLHAAEQARAESEPKRKATGKRYIVLTNGFTYRSGKGRDETQRARRGAAIELDPALVDIDRMLALKAIAPDDGEVHRAPSAKQLALAAGQAVNEPASAPPQDIILATTPERPTQAQLAELEG
jgi:hypothetical protein